ncbi:MAG: hypothetical protein IPG89_18510 [Bacteroidetes bacterium]|nr:hypothetical protein [Bacteroidota bacterium]
MSKLSFKNIQLVLIVLMFSIPKFIFLDQDIPSYMIGGLSQEDEAYYCIGGVNRYLADENRSYELNAKSTIEALQLINTPTTYLSLKIFGNNYYGLRIPIVIVSLLLNLILVLFANKRGFSRLSILLLIIFLSTEFYSFLFGRFYNPQIFCMLFIALILSLMHWSENIGFKKHFT